MRIAFLFLSLLTASSLIGQQKPLQHADQSAYLKQARKQQTVAFALLGGGGAMVVTGVVLPQGKRTGTTDIWGVFPVDKYKNDGIKAGLIITGIVSMLAGVPFLMASEKNKKRGRALSAFIDTEKIPRPEGHSLPPLSYPVAGICITL